MLGIIDTKVYLRRDIQNYDVAWVFKAVNDEFIGKCCAVKAIPALYAYKTSKAEYKEALNTKKQAKKIAQAYAKRTQDISLEEQALNYKAEYACHHALRLASIPVKTENWGGKMHTKGATVDDEYYIIGSMNWTGKAELHNDENLLIISNPLIASVTKTHFFKLWNVIPDKYLTHDPAPEGPESIGSCMDGMDNNHNGYTDLGDFSCRYLLKN